MADYKEMYKRMFQETTRAIRILEAVQQECEELYISGAEPELTVLPGTAREKDAPI